MTSALSSLAFGLNTSYSFPILSNRAVGTSGYVSAFVDFLKPSTKYYYHVYAWASCSDTYGNHSYTGNFYGNWTTAPESTYVSAYGAVIRGTIYSVDGSKKAPAGFEVEWQCTGKPLIVAYAHTNSNGAYSINPPLGATGCTDNGWGYPIVEVNNFVDDPYGGNPSTMWPGYWNESMVVWADQFVNFYLPLNFVRYNVVQIQDYSNANTPNGYPNSTVNFTRGSTYTTFSSHCWTALFVFSGCSKASNTIGTSNTWTAIGHNLVVTENLWESGTVLFDGISRSQPFISAESYYAPAQPPVNQPAGWPSGDNITMPDAATNSSIYPIWGWGAGFGSQGVPVYSTAPSSGSVTVSSQTTSTGMTKGFSVEVGIDIPGIFLGISTTLVSDVWSQTSTSSTTNTLSWSVYGNSLTVPICYAVYGIGGSSSASGSTADAIGVWAFAPNYSGGHYSCPATQ